MSSRRTATMGPNELEIRAAIREHKLARRNHAIEVFGSKAAAFVALTKPRIVELLLVTTVPTMVLASRGLPPPGLLCATLGGGALAAGGANAMNMVIDRDIDARMSRTRGRPLVTGVISWQSAAVFSLLCELAAFAILRFWATLLAAILALGAAAFYVGVYSGWLKRSTPQNIVIGGVAGAAPPLVAWAAVTGSVAPVALALFAVVVFWTPPHFWALAVRFREDYATVGVPMLPVVTDLRRVSDHMALYTVLTVTASLAVAELAPRTLGPIYLGAAALLGTAFLLGALRFRRDPTQANAMALFHFSIVYLALLFLAVSLGGLVKW